MVVASNIAGNRRESWGFKYADPERYGPFRTGGLGGDGNTEQGTARYGLANKKMAEM